jgi:hypothetical protein
MATATEIGVEAIELESFVEEIPDLQAHFDKLQTRLEKGGKKIQCSFSTNRGGVQRAPFWAGTRVQGGAPIQQFGLGTSAPIGGDSSSSPYVPAWSRGSGSSFVSMCASPLRFVNVCELSNLAQQATDGKERGLVKFSREEMDKSLLAFDNGVEAVLNRDGSGTIDQIPTTATINNNTGATGPQKSSIVGLNTAASFVDQQVVQVLSGIGGTNRGSFTISFVDPVTQTVFSAGALPAGTALGDILVIQGATGAAGSSVYGKDYWIQNGNVGTKGGVDISQYPGRFSSPTINFGGSGTIVNSTAQRVQSIRMRAMGDDYDKNEKCFWYANPVQGVALSGNYYNPGYTRIDEGGDKVIDTAKKFMQDTWAGDEIVWSSTAEPSRMDRIVASAFTFGELFPTRLHEWTPGNPIAAVPVNDGTGSTYYDSQMFAYERGFNLLCPEMKQQFFLQGLPIPADA